MEGEKMRKHKVKEEDEVDYWGEGEGGDYI